MVFFPRAKEPMPNVDFAAFIPPPLDAPTDSEWLAHAKYDLLTRDPAPTSEDVEAYAIFVQHYSVERLREIAEETETEFSN